MKKVIFLFLIGTCLSSFADGNKTLVRQGVSKHCKLTTAFVSLGLLAGAFGAAQLKEGNTLGALSLTVIMTLFIWAGVAIPKGLSY